MIYFLQLPTGSIKIGTTTNLDARLDALRSHYQADGMLLATMEGDREREAEIHNQFAHLRLGRTEQFRPGADLMAFIGVPVLVDMDPDVVKIQPHRKYGKLIRVSDEFADLIEELASQERRSVTVTLDAHFLEAARAIAESIIIKKYEKILTTGTATTSNPN